MARRRRPGLTSGASGYRPAVHGVFRFRRAESLGRAGPAVARLAVAVCPIGRVPLTDPSGRDGSVWRDVPSRVSMWSECTASHCSCLVPGCRNRVSERRQRSDGSCLWWILTELTTGTIRLQRHQPRGGGCSCECHRTALRAGS